MSRPRAVRRSQTAVSARGAKYWYLMVLDGLAPLRLTQSRAGQAPKRKGWNSISKQGALQLLPRRIVGGNTPTNTNAHKEPLSAKQKAPSSLQLSQKELREKRNTGALMHVALPRAGGVWRDFAWVCSSSTLGRQARNIPQQVYRARAQML